MTQSFTVYFLIIYRFARKRVDVSWVRVHRASNWIRKCQFHFNINKFLRSFGCWHFNVFKINQTTRWFSDAEWPNPVDIESALKNIPIDFVKLAPESFAFRHAKDAMEFEFKLERAHRDASGEIVRGIYILALAGDEPIFERALYNGHISRL